MIERSLADPTGFAVIFDRHFDAVHGYLSRRVGRSAADDLAASTFTLAFEHRRRFRSEATSARPWLLGIATNLLRNQRRAENRALQALRRLAPDDVTPASSGTEETTELGELLAGLDRDQRNVLLLYAWEELSYEEIANALGIPVGTVRSRLARARARLRARLDPHPDVATETQEMSR